MVFQKAAWAAVGGFDEEFRTTCDFGFLQKIAEWFDLGFADALAVQWTTSPTSLLSRTQPSRVDRELLSIFRRFRTVLLRPSARVELNRICRDLLFDLGHNAAINGRSLDAIWHYLLSLWYGVNGRSVLGLAKLLPARLYHWRSRSSGPHTQRNEQ
jgi:uncharacterized protein YjiS (DUF1127 family)